jgi:hypothetical protein
MRAQFRRTIQIFDYGTTSDGTFYYSWVLTDYDLESLGREFAPMTADRAMFLPARSAIPWPTHADLFIATSPANIVCRMGSLRFVRVLDFGLVKERILGYEGLLPDAGPRDDALPNHMAPVIPAKRASSTGHVYALGVLPTIC